MKTDDIYLGLQNVTRFQLWSYLNKMHNRFRLFCHLSVGINLTSLFMSIYGILYSNYIFSIIGFCFAIVGFSLLLISNHYKHFYKIGLLVKEERRKDGEL